MSAALPQRRINRLAFAVLGCSHTRWDEHDPLLGLDERLPVGTVHDLRPDHVDVIRFPPPPGEDVVLPTLEAGVLFLQELLHIGGILAQGVQASLAEPVSER